MTETNLSDCDMEKCKFNEDGKCQFIKIWLDVDGKCGKMELTEWAKREAQELAEKGGAGI